MKNFHHISLLTRDKEKNLAFYTEFLGLRFIKNTVNQENHRMLHWYYGDYAGTPGTVITFFVVPRLGSRYDNQHSIETIGFNLPKNSLAYWEERLLKANIPYEKNEKTLNFLDPDKVKLSLTETSLPPLKENHFVKKSPVPKEKQILTIRSSEFHVPHVEKTQGFFEQLLDWKSNEDGKIFFDDDHFFSIVKSPNEKETHMGKGSIDHIAFLVKGDQELEALHKKAQGQNWNIEKIISRGYFKSLYIREPGGNRVEFATATPGFTIDASLEHLGEEFTLPPFLMPDYDDIIKNIYK